MKRIKNVVFILALVPVFMAGSCDEENTEKPKPPVTIKAEGELYLTRPDKTALFALVEDAITASTNDELLTITVDTNQLFQKIDGFGFSLTGGSAKLLMQMPSANRSQLLSELFGKNGKNLGVSVLRVSIGASDLDEKTFSYNEVDGDVEMANFDLGYDKNYLIPVLKEILGINPAIMIIATPWSAPTWMKTNNNTVGGGLKTNYYAAYATYFVKYIQQMKTNGITIQAITVQNEPLHGGNNPSMEMSSTEQALFIKNNLGPAFESAGIKSKIIVYDHNADRTDYPISIYNDSQASKYVDGAAFHLYGGSINNLSNVHNAFPNKNLYFTEQWVGAPGNFGEDMKWHIREVIIGATRNWCKIALEWNLASDPNFDPHTPGGCDKCMGAITIDGATVTRNQAYYIIAHVSKFVPPGSQRVGTNYINELPNVAFVTPEGQYVLVVLNDTDGNKNFNINFGDQELSTSLVAGAVATIRVKF